MTHADPILGKFVEQETGDWLKFEPNGYVTLFSGSKARAAAWKRMEGHAALYTYASERQKKLEWAVDVLDNYEKLREEQFEKGRDFSPKQQKTIDECTDGIYKTNLLIHKVREMTDSEFLLGKSAAANVVVVTHEGGEFLWSFAERGDTLVSSDGIFIKER